jgi:hypothetical protein
MPRTAAGHGRDPRVGLDDMDAAILAAARAILAGGGNWDCVAVARRAGATRDTVRARINRMAALGAWPLDLPRVGGPADGRRLAEDARERAARHVPRARRFARACARQYPHLAAEFESEAMLAVVRAARRAKGDLGRYLAKALNGARVEVLTAARPKGYRAGGGAPAVVSFDAETHGLQCIYRDEPRDDPEGGMIRDRIQFVLKIGSGRYEPSFADREGNLNLVGDPARARKFATVADAMVYLSGRPGRFDEAAMTHTPTGDAVAVEAYPPAGGAAAAVPPKVAATNGHAAHEAEGQPAEAKAPSLRRGGRRKAGGGDAA